MDFRANPATLELNEKPQKPLVMLTVASMQPWEAP